MERKLTILLIEDESYECQAIIDYIDNLEDTILIGITSSVIKALEYVKDCIPDTIILDLELHKGDGNGLSFLESINKADLPYHPYILITTNNTSIITYEQARQLGADFIMCKTQNDYNAQNVIDFLRSLKRILHSNKRTNNFSINNMTTETLEAQNKRVLKRISSEIEIIGISPTATGRQYLIDCIHLISKKPQQNICGIIDQKYRKSDASVERAMQNAINRAWRTVDINTLQLHYTAHIKSSKGVPSVMEFIYYYAEKIKSDY